MGEDLGKDVGVGGWLSRGQDSFAFVSRRGDIRLYLNEQRYEDSLGRRIGRDILFGYVVRSGIYARHLPRKMVQLRRASGNALFLRDSAV